jgi:putative hydrolase of the HAD superfamily
MPSPPPADLVRSCIVFDGDDTLWHTEFLYDEARQAARGVVSAAGIDGGRWEELERAIDVQNVAILGYAPTRFPTSCVQAYEAICGQGARAVEVRVKERIWEVASAVFSRIPPPVAGAADVLTELQRRGYRLALLTKGDRVIQESRVDASGLRQFFDAVLIVSEKTASTLLELLAALGCSAEASWMVGNSLRSDIVPALAAGMRAVWIDAHVWEYERLDSPLVLDELVSVLANLLALPAALEGTCRQVPCSA